MNDWNGVSAKRQDRGGFRASYLVFGGMLLALAAVFFLFGENVLVILPFHGWKETPCRIEKSKVCRVALDQFVFNAEFSYEIAGRRFRSEWLCKSRKRDFLFAHLAERMPLLEKYAIGTEHVCRVNPADNSEAFLEVVRPYRDCDALELFFTSLVGNIFLGLGFFIVLVGAVTVLKAFARIRCFFATRKRVMAVAFFILAVALPILKTGVDGIVCKRREVKATDCYVKVSAKVLYSGMVKRTYSGRSRGTVYRSNIGYEYEVDGRRYEGDRFSVTYGSSSHYKRHRHIVDSFKPGKEIVAFVSPDDVRKSVLVRSSEDNYCGMEMMDMYVKMGGCSLLGICLLIIGVRKLL